MIAARENPLLTHDAFLSKQLRRPAWRVGAAELKRLGDAAPQALAEAMGTLPRPSFVDVKLPVETPGPVLAMLRERGFEVIDTAVTLERTLFASPVTMPRVREARPADEEAVVRLAADALTTSRFHRDAMIPCELAVDVKRAWARAFFAGTRGDVMIVAESMAGGVDGFLLALAAHDGAMVIDLVAVVREARRRGVARAMTHAAQSNFPDAMKLRVGTQGSNRDSLAAYERMGFHVVRTELVLHAHVGESERAAAAAQEARCA